MLRSASYGRWRAHLLLAIAVSLAFGLGHLGPSVKPQAAATAASPQHPRIFFSSKDILLLRIRAWTSHHHIWSPIQAFASTNVAVVPPPPQSSPDLNSYRNAGDGLIAFAFAYVITGDSAYLDLTRRHLLAYARWPHWGDEKGPGDRDLGFHHMLMGNALAYDWIYNDLSEADREVIRASLARRAEESYQASSSTRSQWSNWWRRVYSQNHHWVNHSALGMAALVLEGQDPRWQRWLDQAIDNMARVRYLAEAIDDGSWHESIPYQSYALTMSLPFLYNLRRLTGQDLIPHGYLRNYVHWRIYNSLSRSDRFALSYGDFEWSWANGFGVEGVLRFAATEYEDHHAEWMARQLMANAGRYANVWSAPWYVFEFMYYDRWIGARPPDDLPLNRTFPDLEGVIWRTGWGDGDLVFGLKTGAPGGRFLFDTFTRGKQYPFDADSSVDRIHVGHDHDDANSFYLYRGGIDLASETVGYQLTETAYHNTLLVDGLGQYRDPQEGALWQRNLEPYREIDGRLEAVLEIGGFSYLIADATNRYRLRLPGGEPGHPLLEEFSRHVLFVKPDYLVMVDRVRADSPRMLEWVSHFGSSVSVEGDWVRGNAERGHILGVKILRPGGFAASIGHDGKPYVRIRPATELMYHRFITVLYPTEAATWESRPSILLLEDNPQVSGVRVLMNGTQDHLIGQGTEQPVAAGEYSFDGRVASIVRGSDSALLRLFLGQGSHLSDGHGSRMLIRAPTTIRAVQVEYAGAHLAVLGDGLSGVSLYAPGVDVRQVTVNGERVVATKVGDYLVLP